MKHGLVFSDKFLVQRGSNKLTKTQNPLSVQKPLPLTNRSEEAA